MIGLKYFFRISRPWRIQMMENAEAVTEGVKRLLR